MLYLIRAILDWIVLNFFPFIKINVSMKKKNQKSICIQYWQYCYQYTQA